MNKVFIFFLTVSALIAAPTTQMIESYGVGCAYGANGMSLGTDYVKVAQVCANCVKSVATPGIDKTEDIIKLMEVKCLEAYKAERK